MGSKELNVLPGLNVKKLKSLGQDNVFTPVCLSVHGLGEVGFPACIIGYMTMGSASVGSASSGVCIQCLNPGQVCIQGRSASTGGLHSGRVRTPSGYYGIQSSSVRYTSYWNAFMFFKEFQVCIQSAGYVVIINILSF